MLLETTNENLRPSLPRYPGAKMVTDLVILTMRDTGQMLAGYNINYNTANIYMEIGSNSGFVYGGHYIFSGYSDGFQTKV